MRFAAHQPNLLPYAGFWLKMDSADIFGLMPEAQFSKGDYTNRVLIGWEDKKQWLTLPVKQKLKQRISEVELSDEIRMDKVSKTIEQTYGKRRFWKDYGEKVTRAILEPSVLLRAKNENLIFLLRDLLGITTSLVYMPENSGNPSEDLLTWTQDQKCEVYLSGSGAIQYLDTEIFYKKGIEVLFQKSEVNLAYGSVSVLSLLFDYGSDWRSQARADFTALTREEQ